MNAFFIFAAVVLAIPAAIILVILNEFYDLDRDN